ncbi:ATP-dependent DNA/RNA helicase DHX36-like isoform X2 [Coccinella septempunctata]|uniref:ATP-dependent DNA/RNA helicase DHX36-like isoform X2 n=1 Tax=Coccinella septempunctata TaxID=41139 RepID=UPI001D06695B|nr:ATP-dependent DNA/RNA helicase DHX36-like isoform X2 [Coccinella septempunctata]
MYKWKKNYQGNRHAQDTKSNFRLPQVFQCLPNARTELRDSSFSIFSRSYFVTSSVDSQPIGKINISSEKLDEVNEILRKLQPIADVNYESMENSLFKMNFLEKRTITMDQKMDFFHEKLEQKSDIDYELFLENNKRYEDPLFMKMYEKRKNLPSFQKRNQIVKMIQENQVVLISGETGCGKTTQVPQFLLDDYVSSYKGSACKIICTQPRRISAVSVAERVARERGEVLGISVGYQIRLERVLPRKYGSILFVTNGIVIRLMESDPSLNNISHLIIDEIHERDIHSDFLLTLVKQVITRRKDLKVILMSATLNEKRFKEYFDGCTHVEIKGFSHPVEEYYLEDVLERLNFTFAPSMARTDSIERNTMIFRHNVVPYVQDLRAENSYSEKVCRELLKPHSEEINLDLIHQLTMHICRNEGPGAILIFVTGYDDINRLFNLFYELPEEEYMIIALHSEIPMEDQKFVFEPSPSGVRKIILATNIAETSITIDDVVYVIDSGWAKIKVFDPKTNTENLQPRFISKANAIQRKGRAGRLMAGKCFHLYTRARFEAFYEYQRPEILRCRLESMMLQMKFLQLGKVKVFFNKMLDKPDAKIVEAACHLLNELGALDEEEALTPLGYYLAKLPIAPQLGKMLLLGVIFSCLEPILNIAVSLDYKSPFNLTLKSNSRIPQLDPKMAEFAENVKSDHLLLHKALHLYQTFDKATRSVFCKEYNINKTVMKMLKKMKVEFMENLFALELVTTTDLKHKDLNINSKNVELIKSIVCGGLYPNIMLACTLSGQPKTFFKTLNDTKVVLHKKSILSYDRFFTCPLLVFYIKMKTKMDMVFDATVCSPFPVIFFGTNLRTTKAMNEHCLVVNHKLRFSCDKNASSIVEQLRERLQHYITYRLTHPASMKSDVEDKFLKIVVDLLASRGS